MPGSFAKHFLLICTDAKRFAIFCKGHQKVTLQQPWEAGTSLLPRALGKGWGRAHAPEELWYLGNVCSEIRLPGAPGGKTFV